MRVTKEIIEIAKHQLLYNGHFDKEVFLDEKDWADFKEEVSIACQFYFSKRPVEWPVQIATAGGYVTVHQALDPRATCRCCVPKTA